MGYKRLSERKLRCSSLLNNYRKLSCLGPSDIAVSHASFSGVRVALCRDKEVMVCNVQSCSVETRLVGHHAAVTWAGFSSYHGNCTVITLSQDRTFMVWDLDQGCLTHHSPVLSAQPLLCASISPTQPVMVVGGADGLLRVYDLCDGSGYQCLMKCDVAREISKASTHCTDGADTKKPSVISTTSSRQTIGHVTEVTPTTDAVILALRHYPAPNEELVNPGLSVNCSLVAVTHTHLLLINGATLELIDHHSLTDPLPDSGVVPSVASAVSLAIDHHTSMMYCGVTSMFSQSSSILSLNCEPLAMGGCCPISVLSSVPLSTNSPLRHELKQPDLQTKSQPVPKKKPSVTKKQGTVDKPLTFKSKVKSSGYTSSPRMKAFVPKVGSSKSAAKKKPPNPLIQEYPMDGEHPLLLSGSLQVTDRPAMINSCCFSSCGKFLGCAASDSSLYTVRMPLSLKNNHALVGHNESVLSVGFSQSSDWLLSCSSDKSIRVWSLAEREPLLVITTDKKTPSALSWCGFYYLDKFITSTRGNVLDLYNYHIDTSRPDDIKRYVSSTRHKLVSSVTIEHAHNITAVSTINDFHSYVVLLACSDRSVEVVDMNVGSVIRSSSDTHSRPVHCIQQNKGSRFTSHHGYDLYLTAAVSDGIKLWDLRTNNCVSRFSSHANQALPVGSTFSPCGRFIATGSEDRTAVVYDLRSSSPLHRLKGHTDTVNNLTYHPRLPLLATGVLNGSVNYFKNL